MVRRERGPRDASRAHALLRSETPGAVDRLRALIRTIHESRNRQGDLAQVLGEQVRQGVELLVREVDDELDRGQRPARRALDGSR